MNQQSHRKLPQNEHTFSYSDNNFEPAPTPALSVTTYTPAVRLKDPSAQVSKFIERKPGQGSQLYEYISTEKNDMRSDDAEEEMLQAFDQLQIETPNRDPLDLLTGREVPQNDLNVTEEIEDDDDEVSEPRRAALPGIQRWKDEPIPTTPPIKHSNFLLRRLKTKLDAEGEELSQGKGEHVEEAPERGIVEEFPEASRDEIRAEAEMMPDDQNVDDTEEKPAEEEEEEPDEEEREEEPEPETEGGYVDHAEMEDTEDFVVHTSRENEISGPLSDEGSGSEGSATEEEEEVPVRKRASPDVTALRQQKLQLEQELEELNQRSRALMSKTAEKQLQQQAAATQSSVTGAAGEATPVPMPSGSLIQALASNLHPNHVRELEHVAFELPIGSFEAVTDSKRGVVAVRIPRRALQEAAEDIGLTLPGLRSGGFPGDKSAEGHGGAGTVRTRQTVESLNVSSMGISGGVYAAPGMAFSLASSSSRQHPVPHKNVRPQRARAQNESTLPQRILSPTSRYSSPVVRHERFVPPAEKDAEVEAGDGESEGKDTPVAQQSPKRQLDFSRLGMAIEPEEEDAEKLPAAEASADEAAATDLHTRVKMVVVDSEGASGLRLVGLGGTADTPTILWTDPDRKEMSGKFELSGLVSAKRTRFSMGDLGAFPIVVRSLDQEVYLAPFDDDIAQKWITELQKFVKT